MDIEPGTDGKPPMRRLGKVNEKNLVTFDGFKNVVNRQFELSIDWKILKRLVDSLGAYTWRIDTVDLYKFMRELSRYRTKKWNILKAHPLSIKLQDKMEKERIAEFIQKRFQKFMENKRKAEAEDAPKKKDKQLQRDDKIYSPQEIVDELQKAYITAENEYKKSHIESILDSYPEEMVTQDKFRDLITNQLRMNTLSREFIQQLFEKLDPRKSSKVSLKDLRALIFGSNNVQLLTLPETGEELLKIASEGAHMCFDSVNGFIRSCHHSQASTITSGEFDLFVSLFTRFKRKHSQILYEYLDTSKTGILTDSSIMVLWDNKIKADKIKEEQNKSRENRSFTKIQDIGNLSGIGNDPSSFHKQGSIIDHLGDQDSEIALDQPMEFMSGENDNRILEDEAEELIMKIGIYSMDIIMKHGKSLKDLYAMLSEKVTKLMDLQDFIELVKFVTKESEVDETVARTVFKLTALRGNKLPYSRFETLVNLGKKINPICVKLKKRYGSKLREVKPLFVDELNKLCIRRGDAFANLHDVKRLFAVNRIDISDMDCEILKEDDILVQKDKQLVVNVVPFIEKIFKESSESINYLKMRSIAKIYSRFKFFKRRRDLHKQYDQLLMLDDSSPKKISPKQKPGKDKTKKKPQKTTEEKVAALLPESPYPGGPVTVQMQKKFAMVDKILKDIVDSVVSTGENNLLRKNVQRRFSERSVNKDNIVLIQEDQLPVVDILPRSVSSLSSIGRILYMSTEGILYQYDLTNGSMLACVDLSSKIPMKKDEIMDYLLDADSGLLYILKMSWILEAWNVFQKSKSPAAKIKLIQDTNNTSSVSQVYKTRYQGAFPSFLSLSQNSHQYLTVNCTLVNGTVYFLDPISLNVLNQAKIRGEDMKVSPILNKIFYQLKPVFISNSNQHQTFEKVFGSDIKIDGKVKYVTMDRMKQYLLTEAKAGITEEEFTALSEFLDINGDMIVDEDEWAFLVENVRITTKRSNVHASYEIPNELKNIDRTVAKIFYDIYEFAQKKDLNVSEMFKIFDRNNSGSISQAEFIEIIGEISRDSNMDSKIRFFKFIDKDNSHSIDIDEFMKVFKLFGKYSPQELIPSETPRLDMFTIIEKAFENGIDLETEFVDADEYKNGGVEPFKFRTILKSLPFGIMDEDINHYIDKVVQFTNDGNIDYFNIFSNEKYKRIKFIYEIKRGVKDVENKIKDSENAEQFIGHQKIIIENIIHLSAEDIILFTTTSPKSSIIFASRTVSNSTTGRVEDKFESQLLAKLIGHNSKEPPTILYSSESGCLISGEKLSVVKEPLSELINQEGKERDAFSRYYSNITNNKTRTANILIWNIKKDLVIDGRINPPWVISPCRVIENAHNDSIIGLTYMPLCQIIVSSSVDGSIKLWDPISRPYSLVHDTTTQKTKTGYNMRAIGEQTQSNVGFSEVGRMYSGELTCYAVVSQNQRVPVSENEGVPKFRNLEYLIALELGKAQKSAGKLRTDGIIKIFGVERISLEVPVSRFEDPIPKQLWTEMVDLAIQNRQGTKFQFKKNLSTVLEKIMSKVVIQKTENSRIGSLLKTITLERFNNLHDTNSVIELFNLLVNLPMRLSDSNQKFLTIDEIHMHLKRNNYIFPSNMSKEAFILVARDLVQKSSHFLVDHRSKTQNTFLNTMSQKILKKEIEIDTFFTKDSYTRSELKRMLEGFADHEEDIEDMLTELDPFYSNSIQLEEIKKFFSSEIIHSKINEFTRPTTILAKINAKLSRSNKVDLLRNLFSADAQGIGKITLLGFTHAFSRLSRTIDENILKELFILMSEEENGEQYLDLSYFCKKLLTHSEQFELARVYNALGKIKNALRFRLKSLDDLFMENEGDLRGKSVQNLTMSIAQFMNKVNELDIVGLTKRDLNLIGNFLSTIDEDGNSCISLLHLNAYFKKIELKYQFTNLADYKTLVQELKKILSNKQEFTRKWTGLCNREIIGFADMRVLLNHFNINDEAIDLILLKFVDQETSAVNFFNKISAFIEMNSFLDEKTNLKSINASLLAKKLFDEEQQKEKEQLEEKPRDCMDDLIDHLERYESKKGLLTALNVCKKFDRNNTGRVNVVDFINILWYNLEFSKYPESESIVLAFQNEMIVQNNMKTIEYSEVFDKLESRRVARLTKSNTEMINDKTEPDVNLTAVIGKINESLRTSNFNLEKALSFFDRDNCGLVVIDNFRKVLRWMKADLNEQEMQMLEENLQMDNTINYRRFLDLIEIDDKHINVQFDPDIWYTISKSFSFDILEKLSTYVEYLRYFYGSKTNPLVNASVLQQMLFDCGEEIPAGEIEKMVKFAIVGSINNLNQALMKLEKSDFTLEFEYVHMPHFLKAIPLVYARKKELPEYKDNTKLATGPNTDENEKNRIVSKVKGMLRERGVTMWESLLSCPSDFIEGSKIAKYNFLRMLKIIDLDLTMKEKVMVLKVLDPQDTGKIELTSMMMTFDTSGENQQKNIQDNMIMERLIYGIYYGGLDLESAFDLIDESKSGMVSKNELKQGFSKLDLKLSLFEINHIIEGLKLSDNNTKITKMEFIRDLKKKMKKYNIDPTRDFKYSLLAQIKHLHEKKSRNLLDCFREEDIHKSDRADLEMIKKALVKFGLTTVKIHQIKSLVKLFFKNQGEEDESEEVELSEENKEDNLSMFLDAPIAQVKTQKKKYDVNNPNFSIDYTYFVQMIKDEIDELDKDSNGKMQAASSFLKKIVNLTRSELSLFEVFVYFDISNQNRISNMQMRIGLQNLNITFENYELANVWDFLEKDKENMVSYSSFFNAFLNAGCIDIIRFDEKATKLTKNFCFLASKRGNLEELFNKFDMNQDGAVHLEEFKIQCEKYQLGFKDDEMEEIFKVMCSPELISPQFKKRRNNIDMSNNDSNQNEEEMQVYRRFKFKNFVDVFSFFRKKENLLKLLHRFDGALKDRGLSYQKIFDDYYNDTGMAKKPKKEGGRQVKEKKPQARPINMTELKSLLKGLKLSFNPDELNLLCDAFEVETITAKQMETIIKSAIEGIEKEKKEKNALFERVAKEIEYAIQMKNSNIQKVFFEFDSRSDGCLRLAELNQMLSFLKVQVNKAEVKAIFEEIDYDQKGKITIKEFQGFIDHVSYSQHKKDNINDTNTTESPIDPIIKKLQEAANAKQTSLERVIQSQNLDSNQIVSIKVLERVLLKMDCVLKRDELKLMVEAASKDESCCWADIADWSIKNNIDFRSKDKVFSQFPPAVQVILSKILQIFKKMNLSIENSFKYFTKEAKDVKSMRNEFLTLIQGLQIQTSDEELIGLYNFFDERNYGEITKSTYMDKCEIAKDFYKWSEGLGEGMEKKGLTTLTLRQQVISLLEKLYVSFLEMNYNKKQIFAVFDKHGNGVIGREEFLRICENLGMPIPSDYIASLLNFIDPTESQVISLTTLINKMEESVPENAKDTLKFSQAQGILRDIIGKLKVHLKKFMDEYLDLEKKLQVHDMLTRTKTGVLIYDFYRLLSTYGIRLQEGEKMILNAAFKNKKMQDYFDTEALYLALDKISSESSLISDIEAENLEVWESKLLRRVADKLKSMNLSLDKAFSQYHTNQLGYIKVVDFKQLLFSLDINLSQKDVDLLIKRLADPNNTNVINFENFKQRFWACFFEGKAQQNPIHIDNRSRHLAGMLQNKIRFEMKMPLSVAWDKIDRKSVGYATIDDLKDFMVEIKMPVTKEDLGSLFTLIDQGEDSIIDQFEFVDFWYTPQSIDFETKKKKVKKLEADILGPIAKKLNSMDRDLRYVLMVEQKSKNEMLDDRQLAGVFTRIGLTLNDSAVREIMKIVSQQGQDKISLNQLETALYRNGLKPKERRGDIKVDFNDKILIKFLNSLNITANKLKTTVPQMVKEYDEDYDGLLTTTEFYNLIRSFDRIFKLEEIQKLAHCFVSPTSPNKIVIDQIIQALEKQEKLEKIFSDNLCDGDAFKAILENFDPTLLLFKKWGKLKQAKIRLEKFIEENKDKIRGLKLMAIQFKLKEVNNKIELILKNIRLVMQNLKNTSTKMIKDKALVEWIDPAHCSLAINKKELQNIALKQDGSVINEYTSSQQFNLKYETATPYNRFFSLYKGTLLAENNAPVDVRIYPSETLKRISKDGRFFEEQLITTLKLQTTLQTQYSDMFVKVYGYYSRKVGVDPKDRDLYVFYEVLDSDWVSLREFMNSTGGFIRIPFLVTSGAIFHIVKYWFQKILAIVDVCNQHAVCCYVLRPENIMVNCRTLEVKLQTLSGAARITYEGTLSNITDLNIVLPHSLKDAEKFLFFKEELFMGDPYLAPEFFYSETSERTPYVDSWTLGGLLYLLIFGEDPVSMWNNVALANDSKNTKEPSDFYCYDIFPEELVNEILKYDYGLNVHNKDSLISRSIKVNSFEGIFEPISSAYNPHTDLGHDTNSTYKLGSFLDVIQLLMTWKPYERPTAKSLLYSKLFKADKYQEMQMRQFSSLSFFYRSPSKCVRKEILLPLRAICATIIMKPKKSLGLTDQLLGLIDKILGCINTTDIPNYQNLTDEFSKGKNISDFSASAVMDSLTLKIKKNDSKRNKLPNYSLIKFIFENYILDLLLFSVLRHHSQVNEALASDEVPAQNLEEHFYRPVKGFASIMKRLVFELNSYDTAAAPFVSSIVDLLVKFTVGEEYCLASDIIDVLEKDSVNMVAVNTLQEYEELNAKSPLIQNNRFFSNATSEVDFLDKCWSETVSRKPYCFWSNHWSFYLCTTASSVMREAFGDAGLGSASHPVIHDYIQFIYSTKKKPGFEAESSIGYFNHLLKGSVTKSADYFSEILILSNNIISLEDPNIGTTSLKVIVNYVVTIIRAKNIDKVRAALDSRIFLKCLNYLQTDDIHLKETILELIREATQSFSRDYLYLLEKYDINAKFDPLSDMKPRSAEEIQKNFGIISHLAITNEDKMDKQNYVNCVRNYFSINSKLCDKYVRQICLGIAIPSFFVSMSTIIKSNAEILRNKVHVLEILSNITAAPFRVLKLLSHSSIDSLNTLGKLLVVMRSGKRNKTNEYLLPYVVRIFHNLLNDGRRDVLKMMESTVGLRTLLREQNMVIPKRMNLALLTVAIEDVDVYFRNNNRDMLMEANQLTLSRYSGYGGKIKVEKLVTFEQKLKECCTKLVCWLNFESNRVSEYSVALLQDIIFRYIENLKNYFETFLPYYQTNEHMSTCMITISSFFETICIQEFEYLIFDTVNLQRGISNLEWLMLQIFNIYNYYQILGIVEKPEEDEKLFEFRINKIQDMEERGRELVKFIHNSGCLVKYTNCRITQSAHSFLRIIMRLIEEDNEQYNSLLEATKFTYFYSSLIQKQYSLLQLFIRTKTESIHVIGRYVEESNIRIRMFEALLKSSSKTLKTELLESQTIQRITHSLLASKSELDVSFYRSTYKFLVFRNFLPFRAEALSLISLVFWYKSSNQVIYNELINEIIKSSSIKHEIENMKQKKNQLLRLSAIAFFSRLIHANDKHLDYLIRENHVYEALQKEFQEDRDLPPLFRNTYQSVTSMEYLF